MCSLADAQEGDVVVSFIDAAHTVFLSVRWVKSVVLRVKRRAYGGPVFSLSESLY